MTIGTGSLAEVVMNMSFLGQTMLNVFQYEVLPPVGSVAPVDLGQAWWNDVKATYRAFAVSGTTGIFQSVKVRELNNPSGDYGEYAIPGAESAGTRAPGALGQYMPPFDAASLRLVVGTRATRPGHKRVPFLTEGDNNGGILDPGFVTLMQAWAVVISNSMTLGIPALATVLNPIICKKLPDGSVTAHQPVTGYLVSLNITSQNTRKLGRGV